MCYCKTIADPQQVAGLKRERVADTSTVLEQRQEPIFSARSNSGIISRRDLKVS